MTLRIASIAELPLYNQDVQDAGMPQSVTRLRDAIAQADALLIASPEYNFSVTGALKNAVDWLSRTGPQPFKDKPVAILSATAGPLSVYFFDPNGIRLEYSCQIGDGADMRVIERWTQTRAEALAELRTLSADEGWLESVTAHLPERRAGN